MSPKVSYLSRYFYSASLPRKESEKAERYLSSYAVYTRAFLLRSVDRESSSSSCAQWMSTPRLRAMVSNVDARRERLYVTGSRRIEIFLILFLRLYEPYRRLLRLFRFNDRYPDSNSDSVFIPESPMGAVSFLFYPATASPRTLAWHIIGNLSY